MNIRMYDCKFGDCFRIDPEDDSYNSLYVDFGIQHKAFGKKLRESRYNEIINDMPDHMDFILTHYHEDHYDGVVYLMNHQTQNKKVFENIYIPDIWDLKCSVDIVKLILLKGLLGKYYINNKVTLFSFLSAICSMKGRIHFVSFGDTVQDKYTILWPDKFFLNPCMDYHNELLNDLARQTVQIMQSIRSEDGRSSGNVVGLLDELNDRYLNIPKPDGLNSNISNKLSRWENDISIVFHSTKDVTRNILFTGDIPRKYWWDIERNMIIDRRAINSPYSVIKIPHHGTTRYYYDFASKVNNSSAVLIPNGNIHYWTIDYRYSLLAPSIHRIVCSCNNSCSATCGHNCNCNCRNNQIIDNSGSFYFDI